jgi:ATP-dependent Clp protease ATP-binding subunit ClpA
VTRLDVVNFIAHGIKKTDPPEPAKPGEGTGSSPRARRKKATARARRSTSSRRT